MMKEINPAMGFHSNVAKPQAAMSTRLESIALGAVRKRFSPEFVNRIDAVVTYSPLTREAIEMILERDIRALQDHVNLRLGERYFSVDVTSEAKEFLLEKGISDEYGARELKRTIHRQLTQPLATMVARGEIPPGAQVKVAIGADGQGLKITSLGGAALAVPRKPSILIVDDNHDLLFFLAAELREEGWEMLIAENAAQARLAFFQRKPPVVLLDYMLDEDDGLQLALEFRQQSPLTQIILMTGGGFSDEERKICEDHDFPILYKPFLAQDVLNLARGRFGRAVAAARI
jgi:CheY-like chemotaxis protein